MGGHRGLQGRRQAGKLKAGERAGRRLQTARARSKRREPRRGLPGWKRAGKPERDVERIRSRGQFARTLRRLAEALERGAPFRIQIGGERLVIPPGAAMSVEHERGPGEEEVELQLRWRRRR